MKKLVKVSLLMTLLFGLVFPLSHSVQQAIDIPIGPMDSQKQSL